MSTSTPEQPPVEGQDPQASAPAPVEAAPAAPAPQGDGPWAQDLSLMFQDETVRSQVDQYLRTKVQPRMTQLEQETAKNQQAANLWSKLEEDPINTYVAITTEMYGEEAGQKVLATIQQELEAQQQQPQAQPNQAPSDPRIAAVIQDYEQRQVNQQYDAGIQWVAQNHQDVNTSLIHPFVAAANGNFEEAVNMYREYNNQWNAANGIQLQLPETQAPPVIGSDTGSAAASDTPVEPKSQSLGDAIDDFMAENRANREAPPVG